MKHIVLICILINALVSYGQKYVVEKVQLTETFENKTVSDIPKLKDLSNDNNPVVASINSQILDCFNITGYEQSELDEFIWYDVKYTSDIRANILYIAFSGEYIGAYLNYVTAELFFDLESGDALEFTIIPFQALFTLSGYLDFLHKYWLEGVQEEFRAAVECAEFEPYCTIYDIEIDTIRDNKLSVSLIYDCYPHVALGCSPVFSISVDMDSIKPYLNTIGKYMLVESNYMNLSPIEKYLENKSLIEKVPDNVFLFGKIDDKYPISMAINVDNQEEISGLYFYDTKHQKIDLKGQSEDTMFLNETVNNKQTGYFKFVTDVNNHPVYGKWMNADKTKSLDVKFTKVLSGKR